MTSALHGKPTASGYPGSLFDMYLGKYASPLNQALYKDNPFGANASFHNISQIYDWDEEISF